MEGSAHSYTDSEIGDYKQHNISNLFNTVTALEFMVNRLNKDKAQENLSQRQRSPSITGLENIYSDLCFTTSRTLGKLKYQKVSILCNHLFCIGPRLL